MKMDFVLNPDIRPPRNESAEHFLIKQVAVVYLKFTRGCRYVGEEVVLYRDIPEEKGKVIADVVGVHRKLIGYNKYAHTIMCAEVKVSVSDFKNGFSMGGDLNYVFAPKDVIPLDLLPTRVGLIEVDLGKLNYTLDGCIQGVYIKKKASRFPNCNDYQDVIANIAYSYSCKHAAKNPWFYRGFREKSV